MILNLPAVGLLLVGLLAISLRGVALLRAWRHGSILTGLVRRRPVHRSLNPAAFRRAVLGQALQLLLIAAAVALFLPPLRLD